MRTELGELNSSGVPCLSSAFSADARTYLHPSRRSRARARHRHHRRRASPDCGGHLHLHDGDGGAAGGLQGERGRRRQNPSPSQSRTPRRRTRRTPSVYGRCSRLQGLWSATCSWGRTDGAEDALLDDFLPSPSLSTTSSRQTTRGRGAARRRSRPTSSPPEPALSSPGWLS